MFNEPPAISSQVTYETMFPNYTEAYLYAKKVRKPLIVFVRQEVKKIPGCICIREDNYGADIGKNSSAFVVVIPESSQTYWIDGTPNVAKIKEKLACMK